MKRNVKRHAVVQPLDSNIRLIPLTQNLNAIVDAEDYEWLSQPHWCAHHIETGGHRAMRRIWNGGQQYISYMHREILGLPYGDQRRGDHINCNGLDNRKQNLRTATVAQNAHNSRKSRRNTSGLKGVSWSEERQKWCAGITVNNKRIALGRFATKEEAHKAYCDAAESLHGEFARTR